MKIFMNFIILSIPIFVTVYCTEDLKNTNKRNYQFNNRNLLSVRHKPEKLQNKHPVYNEVIKNLTRFNNVITDLVNTYKEIYNNQEAISADYSNCETHEVNTDSPFDRAKKSNHKAREIQVTTSFYSEEHKSNENDQDGDQEVNNSSFENQTHENLTRFKSDETEISDVDVEENDNLNSEENESNLTEKERSKTIKTMPVQKSNTKVKNALANKGKKEPKIIQLEKDKRISHNVKKEKRSNEDGASVFMRNSDECGSISDKSDDLGPNDTPKKNVDNKQQDRKKINRRIDAILDFYGNLKIHAFDEDKRQGSAQATIDDVRIKPWYRSLGHLGKINLKLRTDKIAKTENDSVESIENIKTIARAQVLREDYGEACLKVVVKKCYKACKQASKIYKSDEVFTEVFLNNSRRTCIEEFSGKINARQGGNSKNYYLAAACLPTQTLAQRVSSPYQMATVKRKKNQTAFTGPEQKLNILRDRYERECQNISATKCTNACSNAGNITCQTEKCDKRKLTKLKKECKRYCQWSYQDRKPVVETLSDSSKQDSDDTGSDSSSNSGSDSDSDSDDSDLDDSDSKIDIKGKERRETNAPKRFKIKDNFQKISDFKYLRFPGKDSHRHDNSTLNENKIEERITKHKEKNSKELDGKGKQFRHTENVRIERTKTYRNEAGYSTERAPVFINKFKERMTKHTYTDHKEAKKQKDKYIKEITKKHKNKISKTGTDNHKYEDGKTYNMKHRYYVTEQAINEHENSSDENSDSDERKTENTDKDSKEGTIKHKNSVSDEKPTMKSNNSSKKRIMENTGYVNKQRTTKSNENDEEDSRASDIDNNDKKFTKL